MLVYLRDGIMMAILLKRVKAILLIIMLVTDCGVPGHHEKGSPPGILGAFFFFFFFFLRSPAISLGFTTFG